ncbi:glycosyltransferase [Pseudofrankia sp. BMG5.37]|uniref:glycosyltransferase n=1 Tax=Pseudofrankia sp. BMG5.37 TaxID=3050035 RepID=UPI0028959F75|nr:glycosyltransferase [Pseudofrankia sp. BMG5.37]MDT3443504.1 glycosyltransferase [Pseudofrankia sp. BMG5.37]
MTGSLGQALTDSRPAGRLSVSGPARRSPADGAADVVLTLAWETWADIHRREFAFSVDRLFAHLYASNRVNRLLLVDPWRSTLVRRARRMLGRPPGVSFPADAGTSHLTPMRARRADPAEPGDVAAEYQRYDGLVARAVRDHGLRDPVLIATHPFHAAAARQDHWRRRIYYGWDDFASYAPHARWHEAIRDSYRRISEHALPVAAVTPAIIRTIDPRGPGLVLPNGVEPAEWSSPGPVPPWFAALAHPILLYTGTLGQRLDLDALIALAEANPKGSVVLVGHCADPSYLAPLLRHRNVHVRGLHSRAAVVAMTAAADVCLLPHVPSPLTEAMSPLKLFEYLAAGRPVVASDLEPVRALGREVRIARDAAQFVDQVARAIDEPAVPPSARADFIAHNSWSRRFDELLTFALGSDT